ncbi:MAG: hypothetical protein QXJ15_05375, partial [Candidatus Bathyarchaeia archaeon]
NGAHFEDGLEESREIEGIESRGPGADAARDLDAGSKPPQHWTGTVAPTSATPHDEPSFIPT